MSKNKKNVVYPWCFMILCIFILSIPFTNAKFYYSYSGIAWENYFTKFNQLKDVIIIEDEEGKETDELWGVIVNPEKNSNVSIGDGSIHYDEGLDQYIFGEMNEKNNIIEHEELENRFSEYFINNLKGVEANLINQTQEKMVVTFEINYYAPKIKNDNDVHLTVGVYNSLLRSSADYGLKGEFIVDKGGSDYSTGRYNQVDIIARRTSGADKGESRVDGYRILGSNGLGGTIYYPHHVIINPYRMLYNSGKTIPVLDGDNNSNTGTYMYPAKDNSSGKTAIELLPQTNLEDFVLDPYESASFNLSLYYGDYGVSNQQTNYSFVTALIFNIVPLSNIFDEINTY